MRFYTVYLPQGVGANSGALSLEGAVFVREGFHFWAFLLGPVWCLWRGLWLPAVAILALGAVLIGMGRAFQLSSETQVLSEIVLALLIGLEAANLRGFGLRRRGYVERGTIAAMNIADAETIFFAQAASSPPQPKPASMPSYPEPGIPKRIPTGEDVVGLFPEYRGP
ncbi:MAG: DUF2628 domain-containing protein [Hyphomicrobiales bacterium]|nr:DUF2628 domain-containing protein [Hyphomicrobiales bacterium]